MHLVDPSADCNLIKNGLSVALKKPLLRKENRKKRPRYAKLHKDWAKNQWQ